MNPDNVDRTPDALSARGRWAEMELPVALRIWKPRDQKSVNSLDYCWN